MDGRTQAPRPVAEQAETEQQAVEVETTPIWEESMDGAAPVGTGYKNRRQHIAIPYQLADELKLVAGAHGKSKDAFAREVLGRACARFTSGKNKALMAKRAELLKQLAEVNDGLVNGTSDEG